MRHREITKMISPPDSPTNGGAPRGFSFVEMIVTLAILGIIALVGMELVRSLVKFWKVSQVDMELQRDVRGSITLIEKEIRAATARTVVVDRLKGEAPYSRITFDVASSGEVKSIYKDGRHLYIENERTGQKIRLNDNVRSLSFSYPDITEEKILNIGLSLETVSIEGKPRSRYMLLQKVEIQND